MIRSAAVWVADRYEDGIGLAEFDASPLREVQMLIGAAFENVPVTQRVDSFLATSLCDLAAFCGDENLFLDVVNDFIATKVAFAYWQPIDSIGQFEIDGNDILQYPNIEYADALTPFDEGEFANHIREEVSSLRLAVALGARAYVAPIVVLRDRYFPRLWSQLTTRDADVAVPAP